jgi:gas vesicle protein
MDSLWNKVRKNLVEWYETAYDKTDEVARIGKRKIEITGLNRSIEKEMSHLGGEVYHLISVKGHKGNKTADNEKVRSLVAKISDLENKLKLKEEEIQRIRDLKAEVPGTSSKKSTEE